MPASILFSSRSFVINSLFVMLVNGTRLKERIEDRLTVRDTRREITGGPAEFLS
jgi:hypothetical protein